MATGIAFLVLVALLGGAIGSFLNVVIYRLPVGESIVRPRSRCPACKTPIKSHHNLPVLGWLLIRGKCASCGVEISARYPLIEVAMMLVAVALFHDFAGGMLTPEGLVDERFLLDVVGPFIMYLAFAAALVAVAFIDFDWFIIPHSLSLGGIPFGLLTAFVFGPAIGVTWQDSLIGAGAGAGVFLLVGAVYGWITGRTGLGGGDWKLMGMLGAWLGWPAIPLILILGPLQGIIFGVFLRRDFLVEVVPKDPADMTPEERAAHAARGGAPHEREESEPAKPFMQLALPFGPFLCLAGLQILLFRRELYGLVDRWLAMGM